jgi:hypothetical protein
MAQHFREVNDRSADKVLRNAHNRSQNPLTRSINQKDAVEPIK